MFEKFLVVGALASTLTMVGCAPVLEIQHRDPTQPVAQVWLDGEQVGQVSYGDAFSMRVKPGRHTLNTTPPGAEINAWNPTERAWTFIIDQSATLTLLTPSSRRGDANEVDEQDD